MSGNYPAQGEKDVTRLVQSVRDLYQGRNNCTGTFTLAVAPATTTVVAATNCGDDSKIMLTPRTANAASAIATTYITVANVVRGQFTVTHASSAQVDRTFSYVIES